MNARIGSALTLDEVAEHFAQWRRTERKGTRIPQSLWNEAIELVETHGVSNVTRTLHLPARDLNKRRGIVRAKQRRQVGVGEAAFVEIEQAPTPAPETEAMWMELERPDGMRLRIRPMLGVDLLALVERFTGRADHAAADPAKPCLSRA